MSAFESDHKEIELAYLVYMFSRPFNLFFEEYAVLNSKFMHELENKRLRSWKFHLYSDLYFPPSDIEIYSEEWRQEKKLAVRA